MSAPTHVGGYLNSCAKLARPVYGEFLGESPTPTEHLPAAWGKGGPLAWAQTSASSLQCFRGRPPDASFRGVPRATRGLVRTNPPKHYRMRLPVTTPGFTDTVQMTPRI